MSRFKPHEIRLYYYHAEGCTWYFLNKRTAKAALHRYEDIINRDLLKGEDPDDIGIEHVVFEVEIADLPRFAMSLLGNHAIDFGNGDQTEFVV